MKWNFLIKKLIIMNEKQTNEKKLLINNKINYNKNNIMKILIIIYSWWYLHCY